MFEKNFLKGSLSPLNVIRWIRYKINFRKQHPDYFDPDGIIMFCGYQGAGKTLSAVQYVRRIMAEYPKSILVTNCDISLDGLENQVLRWTGLDSLTCTQNGEYGLIFFLDEGHLEFNSLESKCITIEEIESISQQRKNRCTIVLTAQVYGRVAKPLREQVKFVVLCQNFFGCVQKNQLIDGFKTVEKDGVLVTTPIKTFWWFHSPELYDTYDTYAKIKRLKEDWKKERRIARG